MNMIKKSLQILTAILLVLIFSFQYVNAQDNKPIQQQPTHFVKPIVGPEQPYGIDGSDIVLNYGWRVLKKVN